MRNASSRAAPWLTDPQTAGVQSAANWQAVCADCTLPFNRPSGGGGGGFDGCSALRTWCQCPPGGWGMQGDAAGRFPEGPDFLEAQGVTRSHGHF